MRAAACVLVTLLHCASSLHQPVVQRREAADLGTELSQQRLGEDGLGLSVELDLPGFAPAALETGVVDRLGAKMTSLLQAAAQSAESAISRTPEDPPPKVDSEDYKALMLGSRRLVWTKTINQNSTSWELVDMGIRYPEGADIWNTSLAWVNVSLRHPSGVISNVHDRKVRWSEVTFISVELLYMLSLVAYPAFLVFLLLLTTILVAVCMAASSAHTAETTQTLDPADWERPIVLSSTQLSPYAKNVFLYWSIFCRTIPVWLVLGMPMLLVFFTYPIPQEVFLVLVVYTAVFFFCNAVYMVFHTPFIIADMHKAMTQRSSSRLDPMRHSEEQEIVHWLVIPNFCEDVETLSGSLEAAGQSGIARTQLCVLLAMEEREPEARAKVLHLKAKFAGRFKELTATYHPRDLPNDPPGKASNMAWAFKWLVRYVEDQHQDPDKVMVTVADADSDLHRRYFEQLSTQFVEVPAAERQYSAFQSPVFHVKNYHRIPMMIVPLTMFTAMLELATLADPNAIRFPYSTYSLPLQLGKAVGGWDTEWISEDWHMGMKCFLLTLGRFRIQPLALPTVNYVPEESTWLGTLYARWSQGKRHALGFSDISYYFMALPLLFCQLSRRPRGDYTLQDFWRVFLMGIAYVIRLINTHALVGSLLLYSIMGSLLKYAFRYTFAEVRAFGPLLERSSTTVSVFVAASVCGTALVSFFFQVIYNTFLKDRVEPAAPAWQKVFGYKILHFVYTTTAALTFGVVAAVPLGLLVQVAAVKGLFSTSFEYEIAAKPTKDKCLK